MVREQGNLAQHAVRVTPRRDGRVGSPPRPKGIHRPRTCCRSSPRTRFVSCWLWRRSPTRWDPASLATRSRGCLGQTISEERRNLLTTFCRCRAQGYIAFDDDPFEIASLFVAMAQGEWRLRLGTGMLDKLTDKMIEDHAAARDADLPERPRAREEGVVDVRRGDRGPASATPHFGGLRSARGQFSGGARTW